ncbi:rcc1 [Symbiodinium sp. CCMP2592]|nr:rcc1 [Symbiodinium sp. CCMP2592]
MARVCMLLLPRPVRAGFGRIVRHASQPTRREAPMKRRAAEKEVVDGMPASANDVGMLILAWEFVKPTGLKFQGDDTSGTAFGFSKGVAAQSIDESMVLPHRSSFAGFANLDDGKWTWGTCSSCWDENTIQGKDCESYTTTEKVPVGDVFVQGSGECDQLGLGDERRKPKKPMLFKSLIRNSIREIAVGGRHVLCLSTARAVYSWGCNDDGALGRAPSNGSDGGPSDVEPQLVTMPSGVAGHVSRGDCHSCGSG